MQEKDEKLEALLKNFTSYESTLKFLKDKFLLGENLICDLCKIPLVIQKYKCVDGHSWRCSLCKTRRCLRTNTLFLRMKISFKQLFKLLYYWLRGDSPFTKNLMIYDFSYPIVSKYQNLFVKIADLAVKGKIKKYSVIFFKFINISNQFFSFQKDKRLEIQKLSSTIFLIETTSTGKTMIMKRILLRNCCTSMYLVQTLTHLFRSCHFSILA